MGHRLNKTEEEWKNELTPEQFHVCRKKGTEPAFSGKDLDTKMPGTYVCVCCGQELFDSNTKFRLGTGWPSFWAPSMRITSITKKTTVFSCAGPRSCAVPVTLTWAISSTTARADR